MEAACSVMIAMAVLGGGSSGCCCCCVHESGGCLSTVERLLGTS